MIPEIHRLITRWREVDAENAKARGYLEAWNTYQVCANELEALTSPVGQEEPPLDRLRAAFVEGFDAAENKSDLGGSYEAWLDSAVKYEASHPPAQEAPPVKDDEVSRVDRSRRSIRRELPRKPQPEGSRQLRCSRCGRLAFGAKSGEIDQMPQPNKRPCGGFFREVE